MSKSNAIVLLLACFLLATIIGVPCAQPKITKPPKITVTTDIPSYHIGDVVTITVTISPAVDVSTCVYVGVNPPQSTTSQVGAANAPAYSVGQACGAGNSLKWTIPTTATPGSYNVEVSEIGSQSGWKTYLGFTVTS